MDALPAPSRSDGVVRAALFLTRVTAALALVALLVAAIVRPTSPVAIAAEDAAVEAPAAPAPPASTPSVAPTTSAYTEALKLRGRWAANAEECATMPLVAEVTRDERGERLIWNSDADAAEQIVRLDERDRIVTSAEGWEYRYLRVGDRLQVKDPIEPEIAVLVACP